MTMKTLGLNVKKLIIFCRIFIKEVFRLKATTAPPWTPRAGRSPFLGSLLINKAIN